MNQHTDYNAVNYPSLFLTILLYKKAFDNILDSLH